MLFIVKLHLSFPSVFVFYGLVEVVYVMCGKPLPHLFDKPILSPINFLYRFDNVGLSKIIHIINKVGFIKNNSHYRTCGKMCGGR